MHDPELALRLAQAGRRWVAERFDLQTSLDPLIDRYRQRLGLARSAGGPASPPREGAVRPPRENLAA
jgi:hypothetical protein